MERNVKKMTLNVDKDAFSNGQIDSKLWLCRELEKLFDNIDHIWIYGGWYGITAFMLKTRERIKIGQIQSHDVDPDCLAVADMINENWVFKDWQFKAYTSNCNRLEPGVDYPDLIINTSTEHFTSMGWWNRIPSGMTVALQGNNMDHHDHVVHTGSLEEFCKLYPLQETLYKGQMEFTYPTWGFTRYMVIGRR